MRILLSLSLIVSFTVLADDHDSPEYQPNVAEYYVSVFKDGKDMDDMMNWAKKWNKWAKDKEKHPDNLRRPLWMGRPLTPQKNNFYIKSDIVKEN